MTVKGGENLDKVRVAVVGLGFGAEFIPIYQKYQGTECAAVCRRNNSELERTADRFGVKKRYTSYKDVLQDPEIDAVHINTPIPDHAWMSMEALKAGKHCACTVPMAVSVEDCVEIARLEKASGKVYMMMETAVYTREYLYAKSLADGGRLGRIQFLRGSHQQNMSLPGWPDYWYGFPPMHYATHAVSPLSDIIGKRFKTVSCLGSGRVEEEYVGKYGSPFAVETAHLTFRDSDVCAEVTRSLFNTIRQYRESFDVYGSGASFEWEQTAGDKPVIYTGYEDAWRTDIPDSDILLPPEIAGFALLNRIVDDTHVSFIQGSGHGGSHPHLVHEFICAIREKRKAHVSAKTAANWTMAGILAHRSAMENGKVYEIPVI
jgi:predicted dehydrogenase